MIILKNWGVLTTSILTLGVALLTNQVIGVYQGSSGVIVFPQPSFLPLKIHVFFVGMLVAIAYLNRGNYSKSLLPCLLVILIISLSDWSWRVIIIFTLMSLPLFFSECVDDLFIRIFEAKIFKWLGEISYSLYLVHNLILYPVLGLLCKQDWFLSLTGMSRYGVAFLIISPLVISISWFLFFTIERGGIRLGNSYLRKGV
jgi:peptidoglycan/LPS O-acetylase OafA/YrhL